jgi:hypothetical protein
MRVLTVRRQQRCGAAILESVPLVGAIALLGAWHEVVRGHQNLLSERRVSQMAAEGMTNREIAQALFVTEKSP